jgi:stress-induced morphogen
MARSLALTPRGDTRSCWFHASPARNPFKHPVCPKPELAERDINMLRLCGRTLLLASATKPAASLLLPRLMHLSVMRPLGATIQPLARVSQQSRMMQSTFGDKTVVETCTDKITDAISPAELKIQGAFDDPNGSHISIYCVAEAFEGLRSMKRQQMVYKAIWEEMQGLSHAVELPITRLDWV